MMEIIKSCFKSYSELSQQWKTFRDKGTKLTNSLVNKHLTLSYIDLNDYSDSMKNNIDLQFKFKQQLFKEIEIEYEKLCSVQFELKSIYDKLYQNLTKAKPTFEKLLLSQSAATTTTNLSYDQNLLLKQYQNYEEIVRMYKLSLDNKQTIIENLMQFDDRDQLVVLVSTWNNDTHINYQKIDLIQEIFINSIS
ncbi:hypothetical protein CYY_007235 [Polysphondylium violaceum]|uniref:Uncharacterized protein n=1 Tax=Polysphondylium violaceum TaxID=133409 RepID=A0A8J4UY51_9MYCE|nr:hypothetical protein CYY_007235 [Polysphondylium violaceum]